MTYQNSVQFEIKTDYLEVAAERVAALGKRAKKLGVTPPILEIGKEWKIEKDEYPDINDPQHGLFKYFLSMTSVILHYDPINLGGDWQFAASIESPAPNTNIVSCAPSWDDRLPATLRTAKLTCEHCQTKRNRKKHYVLVNSLDQIKIVGSTCIDDFLGHNAEK